VLATVLRADDGRSLLHEVERRNQFISQEHEATVHYYPRGGAPVEKRWRLRSSGPTASRKVLIRFTYPAEVRGVALLILNQPRGPAIQWLWTPAIGRDRKIAPQDRGGSVLGTDLTFEDLEERSLSNLDVRSEGEATLDGTTCERLVTTPRDPRASSYSSSLLWVDKKRSVIVRAENRRGTRTVRILRFSDFREVQGVQTPHTLEAIDQETGSRTVMKVIGVRYNTRFRDSDFTREALRAGQ